MAKKLITEYTSIGTITRCYEIDVPDEVTKEIEQEPKPVAKPARRKGVK